MGALYVDVKYMYEHKVIIFETADRSLTLSPLKIKNTLKFELTSVVLQKDSLKGERNISCKYILE